MRPVWQTVVDNAGGNASQIELEVHSSDKHRISTTVSQSSTDDDGEDMIVFEVRSRTFFLFIYLSGT